MSKMPHHLRLLAIYWLKLLFLQKHFFQATTSGRSLSKKIIDAGNNIAECDTVPKHVIIIVAKDKKTTYR